MSGIRYYDIENMPAGISEENRQIVAELARTIPQTTFLRMTFPSWFMITDETINQLKEHIPEKDVKEIALLKSPKPTETREQFLLQVESRIGQELRAKYEDVILECCIHPLSGTLVPAEIPPLTTKALELIIAAVHNVLSKILVRNSNTCQCWREFTMLEEQRMDLIQLFGTGGTSFSAGKMLLEQSERLLFVASRLEGDESAKLIQDSLLLAERGTALAAQGRDEVLGTMSKTAFEKKLSDIDRIIQQRWKDDIPSRYTESLDDKPCQHCRKYRQLDETLTMATPQFLHNLFNIAIGGEMPLSSVIEFVQSVFEQIYNPDMIPERKKKEMEKFVLKIRLQEIMDSLLDKFLDIFGIPQLQPEPQLQTEQPPQPEPQLQPETQASTMPPLSGESPQNTSPDSTDTSQTTGDSPRMKLTDDFLPASETGSTTNTAKDSDNNMTN